MPGDRRSTWMRSRTTRRLVDEIQAGDRSKFDPLFERITPAVYSWALLRIPGDARRTVDPDDLTQEVWFRGLLRFPDYDAGRSDFRPWIFGIARNVLLEGLRAARNQAAGSDEFDPDLIADDELNVAARVEKADELEAFVARLEDLPEEERELLLLRGLEGLSHEEIGRRLGLSEGTARKRWFRLRGKLQSAGLPSGVLEEE